MSRKKGKTGGNLERFKAHLRERIRARATVCLCVLHWRECSIYIGKPGNDYNSGLRCTMRAVYQATTLEKTIAITNRGGKRS